MQMISMKETMNFDHSMASFYAAILNRSHFDISDCEGQKKRYCASRTIPFKLDFLRSHFQSGISEWS